MCDNDILVVLFLIICVIWVAIERYKVEKRFSDFIRWKYPRPDCYYLKEEEDDG